MEAASLAVREEGRGGGVEEGKRGEGSGDVGLGVSAFTTGGER